jgi:hypothetical protein
MNKSNVFMVNKTETSVQKQYYEEINNTDFVWNIGNKCPLVLELVKSVLWKRNQCVAKDSENPSL